MEDQIWKGMGEIWTPNHWKIGAGPRCSLRLEPNKLEVSIGKHLILITPRLVETIRSFDLPMPSLTIIARYPRENSEDEFELTSFSPFFRGKRLAQAIQEAGFQISERRRWRTGLEANADGKIYRLQGNH